MSRRTWLLLIAASCATKSPGTPGQPAAPATLPGNGEVIVVDPGRGSRHTLRFNVPAGAIQPAVLEARIEQVLVHDGARHTRPSVPARLLVSLLVESNGPGDELHLMAKVGSTKRDGTAVTLIGGEGRLSRTGRLRDYEILVPDDGPPGRRLDSQGRLVAWLPLYMAVFPDTPVGVGARWRRKVAEEERGMRLEALAEYTLLAFDGRHGAIEVRWTYLPLAAPMDLPKGARLTGQRLEVAGRLDFDTQRLLSTANLSFLQQMSIREKDGKAAEVESRGRLLVRRPGAEPLLSSLRGSLWSDLGDWLVFLNPCQDLDGPLDGPFDSGASPHHPRSEGQCRRGKPEGRWRSYHPGGKLELEGEWRDGLPHGTWTQWGPTGARLGSFTLTEGTGAATLWWPGGGRRAEGGLRRGVMEGPFRSWREDGSADQEGRFKGGNPAGRWISHTADGVVARDHPPCAIIDALVGGGPAMKAGLQKGDLVVEVDHTPVSVEQGVADLVGKAAGPIEVVVLRGGRRLSLRVQPQITAGVPRIGVQLGCP
jgi:hypothetical protein